jgi:hypothetical protein
VAKEDNLLKAEDLTPNERRESARKAGIASGKARREKKALKDTLEELLAMPIKDGQSQEIDKIKSIAGIKGKNITMQEAIMVAMLNKAAKGDVRAAEYVRDTIGQKPDSKMNIEHEGTIRSEKLEDIIKQIGGEGLTE